MAQKTKTKGSEKPTNDNDQSKFKKDRDGYAKMWHDEFEASDKELKEWRGQAKETLKRFIDDRKSTKDREKRTNLYPVNVINQGAMMFGRTPETDVTRKFADPNDDAARVAGTMMKRLLNGDIGRPGDKTARSCEYALSDFLKVDFGIVKARYELEEEDVPEQAEVPGKADAVPAHTQKTREDVCLDYFNWGDVKWSACRVFEDMRWMAFKTPMTRRKGVKRFGAIAKNVAMDAKGFDREGREDSEFEPNHPWDRMNVWEIWSKELGMVFWYVPSEAGSGKILDYEEDPYELENFWPFPRPLASWMTTSRFIPKPEYLLAQDSYQAIERLTTRIDMLTEALRVVGMYNSNVTELQTLLEETDENTMIPVDNWAQFAQEGGLEGAVTWLPLKEVVDTITVLGQRRTEEIEMNRQITGQADIERGQSDPNETLGAQRLKMRATSVRMQRKQDIFADFVSEAQAIKAELICKFFDDDEIRRRSNIDQTDDAEFAEQALQLLRQDIHGYRIIVKSESISLPDFAQMKQERTEFMEGASKFLAALGALPPEQKSVVPELLSMLQWYAAGFRGADTVETALDKLVDKIRQQVEAQEQNPGQQQPDPKVQAEQIKGQNEQQRIQLEAQNRQQEIQAETQADVVKQEAEFKYNTAEEREKHQMELELKEIEMRHDMELEQLKLHHTTQLETMKAQHGMQADQQQHQLQADTDARQTQHQLGLAEQQHQHGLQAETVKAQHGMVAEHQKAQHGMVAEHQKAKHGVLAEHQKAGHAAQLAEQKQGHGIDMQKQKGKDALGIAKLRGSKPPTKKKP